MRLFPHHTLNGELLLHKPVSSIASRQLTSIPVTASLQQALTLTLSGYRRLPVLSHGKITGILTTSDIIRALLKRRSLNSPAVASASPCRTLSATEPIGKALSVFNETGRGGFPLVRSGRPAGFLAEKDILNAAAISGKLKVGEFMVQHPIRAKPDYSLEEAAKMIGIGGYRRLPVTHKGVLVGILTPFDLLNNLHLHRSSLQSSRLTVRQVMNRRPLAVSPHTPALEAIQLMRERGVGGLPVTEDGFLKGIVTERDILDIVRWK